jgi:hypothetical protein
MDVTKLRQQLQAQTKEKEEWMQKFYSQMTEHEVRDRMLNKTLSVLEGEVQRLSAKANELNAENETLKQESDSQRGEIEKLRQLVKQGNEAVTQERWTYAKELEDFGNQLIALKAKLSKTAEQRPIRKLPSKRSSEYLHQIADMRAQLNQLSSTILSPRSVGKTSPKRSHLSPSRRSQERLRVSSSGATSPSRLQSEVEEMIMRIEARLQRAKELTQTQD